MLSSNSLTASVSGGGCGGRDNVAGVRGACDPPRDGCTGCVPRLPAHYCARGPGPKSRARGLAWGRTSQLGPYHCQVKFLEKISHEFF